MVIYIVVPAHNEAKYLSIFLQSIVNQTVFPQKLVVVDDHSTDETYSIASSFSAQHPWISVIQIKSEDQHQPGSKVIQAFQRGFETLDNKFDLIFKLDADLELPPHYIEKIVHHFEKNPKIGIAGGFAYILKNEQWILENLTDQDHVRGALKAYRKTCFEAIGGLKPAMGWDTLDELLAKFYGWEVQTEAALHVKHLKPTGANYSKKSAELQGLAFYQLGYGVWLTLIATAKLALRKRKIGLFFAYQKGFWNAFFHNKSKLVTSEQQKFIQNYRWQKIKQKLSK
ncbi:MAG: glycosyltransferase family 2 protein [Flavobacterium sp.]